MYSGGLSSEDLAKRIYDFDREARLRFEDTPLGATVVIMGGSAFVLAGMNNRYTQDIDVLTVPKNLNKLLHDYDMNAAVNAHIDTLPYNYEDRLVDLPLTDTFLHYQRPSLEDLIVTKLYAMRPPDIEDLESAGVLSQIDWELLEHIVYDKNEARASALNERRYSEMVQAYENYKEEHCNENAFFS